MMLTPFQHFVVGAIRENGCYSTNLSTDYPSLQELVAAEVVRYDVSKRLYFAGRKFAEA